MPPTEFKGFDDWIEIFKGGPQTDSAGRQHDGDAIIDLAVANFDAAKHEPPLVVGHPKDNAPAWGWVDGLKSTVESGVKTLLARFKEVAPEFEELAKAGRYKKRSASFYPDGSLRHVGFLGAAPPAVKGLADVAFKDDGGPTFEFGEYHDTLIARTLRRLRDWFIANHGLDVAEVVLPEYDISYLQEEAARPAPAEEQLAVSSYEERGANQPEVPVMAEDKSFNEAELGAAVAQAKEEARQTVIAEFAEQAKISRAETRKQEAATFCADGVKAGTIIPAWVKVGLPEFMARLDGEEAINFAEGGEAQSPYAWFKAFLGGLPQVVSFKEIADRKTDVSGDAADKLAAIVAQKMHDKNLAYGPAFNEAQADYPELAAEYAAAIK